MRLPANTGKGISLARSRINQLGITQPLVIRQEKKKLNASKTNPQPERQMDHLVDRIGCKKPKSRKVSEKARTDTKCTQPGVCYKMLS